MSRLLPLLPALPVLIDVTEPALDAGPPDPFIGKTFAGRYHIDGLLGRGGMGSVYRATQLPIGRPVALKILLPEVSHNPRIIRRFEHEARIIAALHHPNIIALYDFGTAEDGRMFLVTELMQGASLAERIARDAPFAVEQVIDIGAQVLEALVEAHAAGVIHRDLKPENVFIGQVGRKTSFVKLLDFGIAKVSEEMSGVEGSVTRSGVILGSPAYMAPEQARARPVSAQTDLYALGLVLYEMLAARRAFVADSHTDLLIAQVRQLPPPIERKGGELAGPLIDLIMQCLEKDPTRRPASAAAMLERLEACRGTPPLVVPLKRARRTEIDTLGDPIAVPTNVSKTGEAGRSARRGRRLLVAALTATAALVALLIVLLLQPPAPGREAAAVSAEATPAATAEVPLAGPTPTEVSAEVSATGDASAEVAAEVQAVKAVGTPSAAVPQAADPPAGATTAADADSVAVDAGPVAVARHRVMLESEPSEAEVYRERQRLGTTPLAIEWAADEDAPRLALKKGTLRATLQLAPRDAGGTRRVALVKADVRPPPPRGPGAPDVREPPPSYEMLP